MFTCYHCGKTIKGKLVNVQPTLLAIQLGDFAKVFHPACHVTAERKAAQEIGVPFKYVSPQ
jgi:hypothetical protein